MPTRLELSDSGLELTWPQVLAWRLRRQLLEPRGTKDAAGVARAIAGIQAQVSSAAELAVAVRRRSPKLGLVDRGLWRDRALLKTWAMRGTLHVLPAGDAPAFVAATSTVQPWRTKAWQKYFGMTATDVDRITAAIGEALDGRALSREQLAAEVRERAGTTNGVERLSSGWAELLKPAAFRGLLCQGPPEGGRVTFTRPDTWIPEWRSREPAEGGAHVVRTYLSAHGPATLEEFGAWFARVRPSHVRPWFEAIAEDLVSVRVEGRSAVALARDAPSLAKQQPTDVVRLLPGFDQYVLASGRDVEAILPRAAKAKVSRTAGWISPVVTFGGRITGIWELDRDRGRLLIELFEPVPKRKIATEAAWVADAAGLPIAAVSITGP
jgi:hypothetical protein